MDDSSFRIRNENWAPDPNISISQIYIPALGVIYSVIIGLFAIYLDVYYSPAAAEYALPYTNAPLFALGVVIAALPVTLMPTRLEKPHSLLQWSIYLLAYVPAVIVSLLRLGAQSLGFVIVLLFCMCFLSLPLYVDGVPLPEFQLSPRLFWGGLTAFAIALFVFAASALDVSIDTFTHIGIYGVRDVYKDKLSTLSPLVRRFTVYSVDWLYLAVSPVFLIIGTYQQSWWKIIVGILGFGVVFSITGFKTALLTPVLIIGLLAFYNVGWDYFAYVALGGMSVFLADAAVLQRISGIITPASFARRLVLLPGFLTSMYYDFFSQPNNPVTYFSGRVFGRPFVDYPYDLPVPNLIGATYFDRPVMSANANFWAEGFATLGYAGPILFTALVVVAFLIYNSVTSDLDPWARTLFPAGYVIIVSNSDSISLFVTNGFAVLLVILYLYSNVEHDPPEQSLSN